MAGLLDKKKDREEGEIPMAGMADIAFLLLVFFLVVTTIDVNTGIGMVLPPPLQPDQEPPEIQDRNMLAILVNNQGDIMVEGERAQLSDVRSEVIKHITNNGEDPNYADSPDDAIVSLKTQEQTAYDVYIDVLDEIRMGYREVRDGVARRKYGAESYMAYKNRVEKDEEAENMVAEEIPLKISIAEPER